MINNKFKYLNILFCLAIFGAMLSCSDNRLSGTSTETTNTIAGVVKNSSNEAQRGLGVNVYDITSMRKIESLQTDSNGKFSIIFEDSLVHVELLNVDSSLMSWYSFEGKNKDANFVIDSSTSLEVTFDSISCKSLRLLGTPYSSNCDEQNKNNFKAIPKGTYALTNLISEKIISTFEIDSELEIVLDKESEEDLLFEDFDDQNDMHALVGVLGNTSWYVKEVLDPSNSENDSMVDFYDHLKLDSSGNGYVFHVDVSELSGDQFWLLGTNFKQDKTTFDLSNLIAIKFRIKGQSTVQIAIEDSRPDSDNNYIKTLWEIEVDGDWTEITLLPEDAYLSSNFEFHLPWDEIKQNAGILSFFIKAGSEIFIDDIRFEGLTVDDFR